MSEKTIKSVVDQLMEDKEISEKEKKMFLNIWIKLVSDNIYNKKMSIEELKEHREGLEYMDRCLELLS